MLNIRASDVSERKVIIKEPKSGKDAEVVLMPEQVARRLSEYIMRRGLVPDEHVLPICYSTARTFIKRLGTKLNATISPCDLRRYSAHISAP